MKSKKIKRIWDGATFEQKKAFLEAYDLFRKKAHEFAQDMDGTVGRLLSLWEEMSVKERDKLLPPNLGCMVISVADPSDWAEKAYDELLENLGPGFCDGIYNLSILPERGD